MPNSYDKEWGNAGIATGLCCAGPKIGWVTIFNGFV
jgi:hypothetical protein